MILFYIHFRRTTMRRALGRQLRNAATFVVPEDKAFVGQSTVGYPNNGEDKLMWQLEGNSFPGHEFAFNVPDPEDPITGQKVDCGDSNFIGMAAEPDHQTEVHKLIYDLRKNPPLDFGLGATRSGTYSNGTPWAFAGGALDPTLRSGAIQNGITNQYAAYINESTTGIIKSAGGQNELKVNLTDKSSNKTRILQVQLSESGQAEGRNELPPITEGEMTSEIQAGRLESEIKYHLSTAGAAYHIEGTSGSTRNDEVRSQVWTDNAAHALFWNSLLSPLPSRDFHTMRNGSAPIKIFHAPGYQFEAERVIEEFGGPKKSDLGLEHNKFVVVDPHSKPATALIAGDLSLETARNTLAYLNSVLLFEELDILTIPGDAVYENGNVKIFIGADEGIRDSPNLFGAHHLTLSSDGVGKMWDATTHAAGSTSYDNCLTTTDGAVTQTTRTLCRRVGDSTSTRKSRCLHSDTQQPFVSKTYNTTSNGGLKLGEPFTPHSNTIPINVPLSKASLVFVDSAATGTTLTAEEAGKRYVTAVRGTGYMFGTDGLNIFFFFINFFIKSE